VTENPVDTLSLHESAEVLLQQHRLTEARPIYVEICETAPEDADAWLMLGAIDEQLGLFDDAEEYLRTAIAHAPDMAEAYQILASVQWRKGCIGEAIATMLQACRHAPDFAEAWRQAGRMQLDAGDAEAALETLEHAHALDSCLERLSGDQVAAYLAAGQLDAAHDRLGPLDNDERAWWSGQIHAARGMTGAAIHAYASVSAASHWHIAASWQARRLGGQAINPDLQRDYLQWHFDRLVPVYDHLRDTAADADDTLPVELIHGYLPTNADVLDLGCGTGRIGRLLRRRGDYLVGVDLSQAMLDRAALQGGYDLLIHADLHDTLDEIAPCQLVILADVLPWCLEPAVTLATALGRVTSDGVLLVEQTPFGYSDPDVLHGADAIGRMVHDMVKAGECMTLVTSSPGEQLQYWLLSRQPRAISDLGEDGRVSPRRHGLDALQRGIAAFHRKDYSLASSLLEQALGASPGSSDTVLQLGLLAQEQGDYPKAENYYQDIVDSEPDNTIALFQLGTLHQARDDHDAAAKAYQRAARLGAKLWMLYNNLGWVLKQQGDMVAARRAFQTALYHDPLNRMVLANLQTLEDEEAGREPRMELELTLESAAGDDTGMLLGYGVALREREFHRRAIRLLNRAITLQPDFHDAKLQLALTLQKAGDVAAAIELYQELLDEHPNKAGVYDNLAGAVATCDDIEKACLMWEKGSQLAEPWTGTHSNRLFMYNYSPEAGRDILARVHIEWGRVLEDIVPAMDCADRDVDPERRLRIGYVSADFYGHSVSHFLEPVMAEHDHERFEIFCYANNEKEDPLTVRHRYYADHWRRINGQDDDTVARRIRDDGIDILVDLTGHTGGSRLPVFARKPAPVQATWLGYPNTTGLSRIDYRLTDAWADPPGMTEVLHSERLFRLPDGFLCYQPTESTPAVEVSRGRESTFTFGCFNNLYKLTPDVVRVWSRILREMPESTLLLKSFGFKADCVYERYARLFADNGIDPQRIHMMGRLGTREHLALYNRMDIVLDPFPYNGTTTTCEALWMGVPVIALAGDRHAARVSVSLLSVTGCPELIAHDEDDYVRKAIELARDHERLLTYKSTLRRRMRASPLTDARGFTRRLEAAYTRMWQDRWAVQGRGAHD